MRFNLMDRIVEVQPGQSLIAGQEPDPGRRVPGRPLSDVSGDAGRADAAGAGRGRRLAAAVDGGFRHSVIVLREAKNVKYGTFMEPGRQMDDSRRTAANRTQRPATFKGKGESGRADHGVGKADAGAL